MADDIHAADEAMEPQGTLRHPIDGAHGFGNALNETAAQQVVPPGSAGEIVDADAASTGALAASAAPDGATPHPFTIPDPNSPFNVIENAVNVAFNVLKGSFNLDEWGGRLLSKAVMELDGARDAALRDKAELRDEIAQKHAKNVDIYGRLCKAESELAALRKRLEDDAPYCYIIGGDDDANANGFIDACVIEGGEFHVPLYKHSQSALLAAKSTESEKYQHALLQVRKALCLGLHSNDDLLEVIAAKDARIEELEAEGVAMKVDAETWRWCKVNKAFPHWEPPYNMLCEGQWFVYFNSKKFNGQSPQSAINAARASHPSDKGAAGGGE